MKQTRREGVSAGGNVALAATSKSWNLLKDGSQNPCSIEEYLNLLVPEGQIADLDEVLVRLRVVIPDSWIHLEHQLLVVIVTGTAPTHGAETVASYPTVESILENACSNEFAYQVIAENLPTTEPGYAPSGYHNVAPISGVFKPQKVLKDLGIARSDEQLAAAGNRSYLFWIGYTELAHGTLASMNLYGYTIFRYKVDKAEESLRLLLEEEA